jgi:hypothetical protein
MLTTVGDTLRIIGAREGIRMPPTAGGMAAGAAAKCIPAIAAASSEVQMRPRGFIASPVEIRF